MSLTCCDPMLFYDPRGHIGLLVSSAIQGFAYDEAIRMLRLPEDVHGRRHRKMRNSLNRCEGYPSWKRARVAVPGEHISVCYGY